MSVAIWILDFGFWIEVKIHPERLQSPRESKI
jgi:hypothetical protein